MRLAKRLCRIALATGCVASLSLISPGSASATAPGDLNAPWDGVANSSQYAKLGVKPVISGMASSSTGTYADINVVLFVEPTDDQLATVSDSSSFYENPISQVTPDATGAWALVIPPTLDLTSYETTDTSDYPTINMEAVAFGPNGADTYPFTSIVVPYRNSNFQHPQPDGTDSDTGDVPAGTATAGGTTGGLEIASDNTGPSLNADSTPYTDDPTQATAASVDASPSDVGTSCSRGVCCKTKNVATYNTVPVHVGTIFSNNPNVTQSFTFTKGARSSQGVAVSLGSGSFKAEGSHSASTNATQGFANQKSGQSIEYDTYFQYKKSQTSCIGPGANGKYRVVSRKVQETAFDAGTLVSGVNMVAGVSCAPESKGDYVSVDNSTASTDSSGVSIAGSIGINLKSTTGYSQQVQEKISFTSGGGHACGSVRPIGGKGSKGPGALVAKT